MNGSGLADTVNLSVMEISTCGSDSCSGALAN